MTKQSALTSSLTLILVLTFTSFAFAQDKKKPEVTIKAEVIDTKCYISGSMGDASGEEHKECAILCAKAGVPLGLLEEKTKTVYFVARLKGMAGANDMLLPFVGTKVLVTGKVTEKGGAKLFLLDTIENAK
jgi:hypothetical protein